MDAAVKKERESGIELFRIITMLSIVAHHYVVNSGLMEIIRENPAGDFHKIFLLVFGAFGKIGINCFVLITGYFMCRSNITLKKFLKLLFEILFYRIILYAVFVFTGSAPFSVTKFVKLFVPIGSISSNFTPAYLAFFLFIPFLNILISNMNEKQHLALIVLSVSLFSLFPTFFIIKLVFNYTEWFVILYIIGSYLRLYREEIFSKKRLWGILAAATVILSCLSVICTVYFNKLTGFELWHYHFVADSNKILALMTAVCLFLFFKNLNIGYVRIINMIAASSFGVLLIHANSEAMRNWLWTDTLKCTKMYDSQYAYIHPFLSVAAIYIICTLIDMCRIKFAEKPFFKLFDKIYSKKEGKV